MEKCTCVAISPHRSKKINSENRLWAKIGRSSTEYLSDGSYDSYAYDPFGDLTQIANNDVSYTYTYTPRHEMASKTDNRLGKTLAWTYDKVGNVRTKTDYQGDVTEFQYDSTNRLVAEKNAAYLQVSYHYDGAGRLLNRILSNGAQTDYKYDNDNRLTGLKNQSADGTAVEDLTYTRDRVGNITSVTDAQSGRTIAYTYNARYQLTNTDSSINSEDRAYTYDAVGNRQTETANATTHHYCYQTATCGGVTPTSGNRLINLRTGSPIYSVTYNGKGRASQINGTQTHAFAYDPNDYRIQKDAKLYHLEGEHLEATYSSSGQLQNTYLRGVVVDEIVNGYTYHSSNPNDWTNYTFHHDHLNSVTAQTGHAGSTEETTKYDAFGAPLNLVIPGTGNDLLYTGREYDRGTGLYYYRARYYDPEIGRFISEDPLGFQAGINFYAYVNNNPINFNDPTGTVLETAWDIFNVGLGAYSFQDNIRTGSYGWAALDGLGLIYDGVATAVPFLPAGASAGLQALRAGNNVVDSAQIGFDVANAARLSDAAASNSTAIINTSLDAAREGTRIHSEVATGLNVSDLGTNAFRGSNGAMGRQPDLYWEGSGMWADLTTQGQWGRHVSTYSNDFGVGIPLFYETGRGITNSTPLPAFMGSLTTGSQFLFDSGSQSAGGGFVLYPSRPNTNMMQSVYRK